MLSLLFDCGMHEIDAVLGGVNHFPLAIALSVGGDDGFAALRALLDDPEGAAAATALDGPAEQLGWEGVAGEHWTKADVLANNAVRFELFQRFGVLPCSGDHHSTEFMPGFVHAGNDYGKAWRVHVYRLAKHMADAEADVANYESIRDADDVPAHAVGRTGRAADRRRSSPARPRHLPVNLPNAGNVTNLPDGAVVEIMGTVDGAVCAAATRTTVPGVMGEWLRRVHTSQELTVEAALTGDRSSCSKRCSPTRRAAQLSLRRRRRDDRRDAHRHGTVAPAVRPTTGG